ncbi:MAG: tetratricopeptide repeat protein, partial [Deinococcales bacterium]|nr:tetratricopeptide repeat protein [Chitinophagaceae bacterium]
PDKSLANIETLEKKYPKDARVAYLHGLYNYRSNNTLAALTSFTKAIELNPKFESAYIARSYAFNAKGMTDKAIEDVTAYIKLKPSDGEGYDQRAAYYFAKKDYANALADFDKEIAIWPKRFMTYYDAANTMALLKDARAGDSYFEKGLATDGINKDELNILYAVYLGQKGRYTEAKEKFTIALRDAEDKFYGSDFSIAGLTYYKTKDLDKAIYCYIKAIALNPKDMSFRSNLAGVYLDKKDYNNVLETAKAALAINGDDALNNMFMAVGLKNMGREAEAKVFEDKAKQLEKEQNN